MLNDIINIDLHIHSIESEYKEEKGYLKNSTIDNIDVLLKKLNENNINLFARECKIKCVSNKKTYALYFTLSVNQRTRSFLFLDLTIS